MKRSRLLLVLILAFTAVFAFAGCTAIVTDDDGETYEIPLDDAEEFAREYISEEMELYITGQLEQGYALADVLGLDQAQIEEIVREEVRNAITEEIKNGDLVDMVFEEAGVSKEEFSAAVSTMAALSGKTGEKKEEPKAKEKKEEKKEEPKAEEKKEEKKEEPKAEEKKEEKKEESEAEDKKEEKKKEKKEKPKAEVKNEAPKAEAKADPVGMLADYNSFYAAYADAWKAAGTGSLDGYGVIQNGGGASASLQQFGAALNAYDVNSGGNMMVW